METQTDNLTDQTVEQYVLQNPTKILQMLGLSPDQFMAKSSAGAGIRRSRTSPDNHLVTFSASKTILNNNNHEVNDMPIETLNDDRTGELNTRNPWNFAMPSDSRRYHGLEKRSNHGVCASVSNVHTTDS